MDDRSRSLEELRRGTGRNEDMRHIAAAQVLDQQGETHRRAAELRSMVDEEHRDTSVGPREDTVVEGLDALRVLARIEELLGVSAGRSTEALAAFGVAHQRLDRVRESGGFGPAHENACLVWDEEAAAADRAGRQDRYGGRGGLDHRSPELGSSRRGNDEIACLIDLGCVARERDKADDVLNLEQRDELFGLALVVAREIDGPEQAARDRREERVAPHRPSNDEIRRLDAS
jgi:hypothetical protein